jgi:transcriptional repressor NrdR
VSAEAIDSAIQRIEEKLLSSGEREIMSVHLGELVMHELKRLDKIAYIRFASVYKVLKTSLNSPRRYRK